MKMPFVEIQEINLDPVSLIIPYYFGKLAALRKKPRTLTLRSFSLVRTKLMLDQVELAWHLPQFQFH